MALTLEHDKPTMKTKHYHPSKYERCGSQKPIVKSQCGHGPTFWESWMEERRPVVGGSLVALEARLKAIREECLAEFAIKNNP